MFYITIQFPLVAHFFLPLKIPTGGCRGERGAVEVHAATLGSIFVFYEVARALT